MKFHFAELHVYPHGYEMGTVTNYKLHVINELAWRWFKAALRDYAKQ